MSTKRGVGKCYFLLLLNIFLLILSSGLLGAVARTCFSCENCSAEIRNSTSGDVIRLTTSISIQNFTCINNNGGKSGFTFDCQNNTISGNGTAHTAMDIGNMTGATIRDCNITNFTAYGIKTYLSNSNNIIRNIRVSYVSSGVSIPSSQNTVIDNIIANNISGNGVYIGGCRNVNVSNVFASGGTSGISMTSWTNNSYLTNITAYGNTYGIYLEGAPNNTINNSYLYNNGYGVYVRESNYTTIMNTQSINNSQYGIYSVWTISTFVRNAITMYNNWGIYLSVNSTIINVNSSYNNKGIVLGEITTIINSTVQENNEEDIYPYVSSCKNKFTNVTGSGWRTIEYYNYSVNIQNKILSQLLLCNAHYSNITNVTIQGSDTKLNNGLYLYKTNNANISNINSSYNYYGFYLGYSNDTIFRNIIGNNNSQYGIYFYYDRGTFISNATLQENDIYDIYIYQLQSAEYCYRNLTDINGSGGRAIEYYNYSVNIQNKILSQLILCNADNSNITNVTIQGSDTKLNNGFCIYRTDNVSISNINSSYNYYGIASYYSYNNSLTSIIANNNSQTGIHFSQTANNFLRDAISNNNFQYGVSLQSGPGNNSLTNITANYNNLSGILMLFSDNNTLTNITANYNLQTGVELSYVSKNNTLINITANYNNFSGLYFSDESLYNLLKDSRIENNIQYGIYFARAYWYSYPQYNLIYNNYFKNSVNYGNNTNLTNYFNISKTFGINVIGGSWIGGNYWATPSGTGFSQLLSTCPDSEPDGICDSVYNVDGGDSYDYFPLTTDLVSPDISITYPPNNTNTTNKNINVNYTVSDNIALSSCWYTNTSGAVNYTLTCGQNITGVTWLHGTNSVTIWVNDSAGNVNYSSVSFFIPCVESWTCTSWSTCISNLQTRTCTDSNSCGTNSSKPAESQSCVSEGGGTLPIEETTTVTQTITITPEQPAEVIINNPKIDLTKITINVLETISGASLTVTKVDVEGTLQIGLPSGESYQAFKIETTGLNNTNIANVTIEFKVNKTWLKEKNGTIENIRLYKKPTNATEWNPLTTSFVNQDEEYYYFSSLSSGFSTFIVFFSKYECQPGIRRCYNGQSQLCLGNSTWLITEKCRFGCDEQGNCIKTPPQSTIIYMMIIVVISVGIIITSYLIIAKIFGKKKR